MKKKFTGFDWLILVASGLMLFFPIIFLLILALINKSTLGLIGFFSSFLDDPISFIWTGIIVYAFAVKVIKYKKVKRSQFVNNKKLSIEKMSSNKSIKSKKIAENETTKIVQATQNLKGKLILPISILSASIILGGFLYASKVNKQGSIERQQELKLEADKEKNKIELEAIIKEREYVAKRRQYCHEIGEKERKQWNNMLTYSYEEETDVCSITYKNNKWKEGDPILNEYFHNNY